MRRSVATALAACAAAASLAAAPGPSAHDVAAPGTAAPDLGQVVLDTTPDVDALLSRGQGLLSLPLDDAARQAVALHLLAPDLVDAPTLAAAPTQRSRPDGGVVLIGSAQTVSTLDVAGRTPDLDGDGIEEVAIRHGRATTVVSGATGRRLWSTDLPMEANPTRLADVDGDGVGELASTTAGSFEFTESGECNGEDQGTCTVTYTTGMTVSVLSGRTGARVASLDLTYREESTETVDMTGRELTSSVDLVDLTLVPDAGGVVHGILRAELSTSHRIRVDSVTGFEEVGERESAGTLRLQTLGLDGTPRGEAITRDGRGRVGAQLFGPTPRGQRPALLVTQLVEPDDRWICTAVGCVDDRAPRELHLAAVAPDGSDTWTRTDAADSLSSYARVLDDVDGDGTADVYIASTAFDLDWDGQGDPFVRYATLVDGATGDTRWELEDAPASGVLAVEDGDLWLTSGVGMTTFSPDGGTTSEVRDFVRVRGTDGTVLDQHRQSIEASFGEGDTPVSTFYLSSADHDADGLPDVLMSVAVIGDEADRSLTLLPSTRDGGVLYEHDLDELLLVAPGLFDVDGDGAGDLVLRDAWWRAMLDADAEPVMPPTTQRVLRMPGARVYDVPVEWSFAGDLDGRPGDDALFVSDDAVTAVRGRDGKPLWTWRA